jgi:hypothetical protein
MTDRMDHNRPFSCQDFINNPVITDSKLVKTAEIPFQRLRSDRIEVLRQPLKPLHDPSANRSILPLEILDGRIQDAKAVHRLSQPQPAHYIVERLTSLSSGDIPLLAQETLAQGILKIQTLIGISKELDQLFLDEASHHFPELTGGHLGNGLLHIPLLGAGTPTLRPSYCL